MFPMISVPLLPRLARRTGPVRCKPAASLLLPRLAAYGGAYFLIALPAQMAVLIAATWLILGRVERVGALLKLAMVVGLVALGAGKTA